MENECARWLAWCSSYTWHSISCSYLADFLVAACLAPCTREYVLIALYTQCIVERAIYLSVGELAFLTWFKICHYKNYSHIWAAVRMLHFLYLKNSFFFIFVYVCIRIRTGQFHCHLSLDWNWSSGSEQITWYDEASSQLLQSNFQSQYKKRTNAIKQRLHTKHRSTCFNI